MPITAVKRHSAVSSNARRDFPSNYDALIGLFDKLVISEGWKSELVKRDWTGIYMRGDAFAKYIETETTRIPDDPSTRASDRPIVSIAAFEAP